MMRGTHRPRVWRPFAVAATALAIVLMWHRGVTAPLGQDDFWVLMTGVPEQSARAGTAPGAAPGQSPGAWLLPGEFAVARYPVGASSLAEPMQVVAVAPDGVDMRDALSFPYDVNRHSLRPGTLDGLEAAHREVAFADARMVSFWHRDHFEVGQICQAVPPVIYVTEFRDDHGRACEGVCIYQLRTTGGVQCLWSSYHEGWLFLNTPDVRLVPHLSGEPPTVVAYQPPFGLGCWRWSGGAYRLAVPRGAEWRMVWATITNGLLYSTLPTLFIVGLAIALSIRALVRLSRRRRG